MGSGQAENPGECVVNSRNAGESLRIFWQASMNLDSMFSIFQTSPLGLRPKEGGSMIMASYFFPLSASTAAIDASPG